VTRWFLLGVIVACCGAGCGAGTTSGPDESPNPTQATVEAGRFQLTFEIARTVGRPGDVIEGVATLRLLENGPGALSGSGSGLLGFSFHEVGGAGRSLDPVFTSDCAPYRISVDKPISSPIVRSGGYSADEPDAEFKRSLLEGSVLRLPAGTWNITAQAGFIDGANCEGQSQSIAVSVQVRVIG
jgi:hypothetical protein